MRSLAANSYGSDLIDLTGLRIKAYSGRKAKQLEESEEALTQPLEVFDSRFSTQTLRVNDIGGPQGSFFFECLDHKSIAYSWVVGLNMTHILYGFRPALEVEVLFREHDSLKPLADVLYLFGVEGVYAHIMKASIADLYNWIDPILAESMPAYREGRISEDHPDYWLHKVVEEYDMQGRPLDAGILNVYLLNLCHVGPGQALRIDSNQIFMPLRGMCLEALTQMQSLVEFDAEFWLHSRDNDEDHLEFKACQPFTTTFPHLIRDENAFNAFDAADYCFAEVPAGGINRHNVFEGQLLLVTEGELWVNGKIRVAEKEAVIFSEKENLHIHGVVDSHYLIALVS
ncbi:hypothetical protein [Thaumasiovibrio subtropicus]|uniref:hypothetical protein n=1 Tax=Thaumasiovibrio subtropicus TaxID=1891207 RepID=UPI000B361DAC|nr:hypothetical protein [Thaumasiovibrio subtropicus]